MRWFGYIIFSFYLLGCSEIGSLLNKTPTASSEIDLPEPTVTSATSDIPQGTFALKKVEILVESLETGSQVLFTQTLNNPGQLTDSLKDEFEFKTRWNSENDLDSEVLFARVHIPQRIENQESLTPTEFVRFRPQAVRDIDEDSAWSSSSNTGDGIDIFHLFELAVPDSSGRYEREGSVVTFSAPNAQALIVYAELTDPDAADPQSAERYKVRLTYSQDFK